MREINPAYVNEGLIGIRRNDVADVRMPSQTDAIVSGGPIERHVDAIFRGKSAADIALDLTRPHIDNPDIERSGPRSALLADHGSRLDRKHDADPSAMSDVERRARAVFTQLREAGDAFESNNFALTRS